MSPEQWNRMVELFHAARERTQEERIALLDSVGSDDPALRLALEQMLKDDQTSCSFLDLSGIENLVPSGSLQSTPATPGAKFGRYEVLGPIGRGGMGEIWAARDSELNRSVALKFLFSAFGQLAERLTHEARAASALNHPNIVTVHEVIWHEDTPIIVMELVEGEALRAVSGTPQPVEQVIQIGVQCARALAAAHSQGIVHCDIKPENILVRRDGYVKLLDFGLACQIENQEAATKLAGTLRYMSPEQSLGECISSASDVFSLGLVLYELATGRHPFADQPAPQAVRSVATKELIAPSSINSAVPELLNCLILRMLSREAAARPSAEEIARSLQNLQRHLDHPGATVRGASGTGKWIALAGLLMLLVAGAIWFWKRHQGSTQPSFYQVTTLVPENRATAAAISADGKRAAYANVDGIFVRNIQSGEIGALVSPSDYVADSLAWFADGKNLVASGFSTSTNVPAIWSISVSGAPPRLLRAQAREATPSWDGKRIAFTNPDRSEIWIMGANGEQPRRLVAGHARETFPFVFWSPDGRRLGVEDRSYSPGRQVWDVDMERSYERRYEVLDSATGRMLARVKNLSLNSASWLPDGRLLFLGWDPFASVFVERLFEVKVDSRTGSFLTAPRQIANPITELETHMTDMSVTRDGKLIMVLKQSNQYAVFTGDFDRTAPRITNIRRLTLDERTSYPHAWTRDNRAVIFESSRRGNWDLFRQDLNQRTAEPIVATPAQEVLPQIGPDGRWILYASSTRKAWPPDTKLMRVPLEGGGTPQQVPIGGTLDEFHCALGFGKRCVLRISAGDRYRAFYDLDPIRGKGRELARIQFFPEALGDWDVSPDGKYVAVSEHDPRGARILLVALEPRPTEPREREVVLPGLADLNDVIWSADGKAWFVSVNTSIGNRLLYVSLDGQFRFLGDIQGWAVPSPDGRRVAFLDRIVAINAWMIDRR